MVPDSDEPASRTATYLGKNELKQRFNPDTISAVEAARYGQGA